MKARKDLLRTIEIDYKAFMTDKILAETLVDIRDLLNQLVEELSEIKWETMNIAGRMR